MTSRDKPQECFVYIVLPSKTEFVTAGRFQLGKDRSGALVGRLVYGKSYLALECGDMGRYAHAGNLLSQAARFLLKNEEAQAIIDAMEQTVKDQWLPIARKEGVSEKDCESISGAFAYPGFRLESGGH